MTPYQHQYPHFTDTDKINSELQPFHLYCRNIRGHTPEEEEYLAIGKFTRDEDTKSWNTIIKIEFGNFFMLQDSRMYVWQKYTNGLGIHQYNLDQNNIADSLRSEFLELLGIETGPHHHPNDLIYDHFVTYFRKSNLARKEEYHEQYTIVHLHKDRLTMIPFDSFNETGGDPLYMWPALASFDPVTGKLHGTGMRMGSFSISLPL